MKTARRLDREERTRQITVSITAIDGIPDATQSEAAQVLWDRNADKLARDWQTLQSLLYQFKLDTVPQMRVG